MDVIATRAKAQSFRSAHPCHHEHRLPDPDPGHPWVFSVSSILISSLVFARSFLQLEQQMDLLLYANGG